MSEQHVCTKCGYVMVPTGAEPGADVEKLAVIVDATRKRAVRRYEALAKMEYRAEQAEAQVEKLLAALADLLQQARPVHM